jgi:hypothetical protein
MGINMIMLFIRVCVYIFHITMIMMIMMMTMMIGGGVRRYVVGDLDTKEMERQIEQIMGKIPPLPSSSSSSFRGGKDGTQKPSLKEQSRHFPPVVHYW